MWVDSKGWWDRLVADFGKAPVGPPARQNLGRAEAMLGDWPAAAAAWGDVSGYMTPPEKLAAQYRAREAKKHPPAKQ
jgi:hypothetical protein